MSERSLFEPAVMNDEPDKFFCFGGPLDGQMVVDQGPIFFSASEPATSDDSRQYRDVVQYRSESFAFGKSAMNHSAIKVYVHGELPPPQVAAERLKRAFADSSGSSLVTHYVFD